MSADKDATADVMKRDWSIHYDNCDIGPETSIDLFLQPANELWDKVIFSQASVILSTGGGGMHIPLGTHTPWHAHPRWKLRDAVNEWMVRILLECILVDISFG